MRKKVYQVKVLKILIHFNVINQMPQSLRIGDIKNFFLWPRRGELDWPISGSEVGFDRHLGFVRCLIYPQTVSLAGHLFTSYVGVGTRCVGGLQYRSSNLIFNFSPLFLLGECILVYNMFLIDHIRNSILRLFSLNQ